MSSFGLASLAGCLNHPRVCQNLNQVEKAFGLYGSNDRLTKMKVRSFVHRVLSAIPVIGILTGATKIERGIKGLKDSPHLSIYHKTKIIRGIGEILGLGALFLIADAAVTAKRELHAYLSKDSVVAPEMTKRGSAPQVWNAEARQAMAASLGSSDSDSESD